MGFGDKDIGGIQDFPDADFNKSLDEAFGSKSTPTRSTPGRTKSGARRHRARSPTGDNRSVDSKGSAEGGTRKSSTRIAGAGVGRQRSNRRASLAAAVNLMASASNGTSNNDKSHGIFHHSVEDQVSAARAERKVPRRAKHEDRLQAAAMADNIHLGAGDLGYGDDSPSRTSSSVNRRHQASQQLMHSQDLGYGNDGSDNASDDYGYGADAQQQNNNSHGERGGRDKRSGRRHPSNEGDSDRRTRFQQKGHGKSFDESFGNVRAQRSSRRRASLAGSGGPVPATSSADEIHNREGGLRARRSRRASLVASEGAAAAATSRAEPSTRGIRESRSAARIRRASMAAGVAQDSFRGGTSIGSGFTDSEGMDNSQEEERQEWQEKRANKQKDMLERLRKSKEAEEQPEVVPEPEEEEEPEPIPEPAVKPRARRRASLGILGMSSTNFAMVENDDAKESRKEEKARKKEEKEKAKAIKKTPSRTKSADGGITAAVAAAGGGQRARAADRDRRRPGTMLDRIGT